MATSSLSWDTPGRCSFAIAGVVATTGGAIAGILNPEGRALLVLGLAIYKSTPSTGAANVDAGIAADATTSSDTLIDGAALNGAGTLCTGANAGTNGKVGQVWGATQYLTLTGSADSSGLVGDCTVFYVPIGD